MADPRFYRNRGPWDVAAIAAKTGILLPPDVNGAATVSDLANLEGAGPSHLSFFSGARDQAEAFARSRAGFVLLPSDAKIQAPTGMVLLRCSSVPHAFAAIAAMFYPDRPPVPLKAGGDPSAKLGPDVTLGPGVVIGAHAEIGGRSRIGANTVIGPGVTIGQDCEIGSTVSISHAHLGDRVVILPGAQIGQPGFGFASSDAGHVKIPQLGRVMIQDGVEIGAACAIDRGSLGDTVIGEGTKIDNLVQIGHNVQIGRHCVLVAQVGVGGSSVIEDFAILGGQVGIADHVHIGSGARLAARTAAVSGQDIAGGQDSGGVPAKPIRQWLREIHAVNQLARRKKQDDHG